MNMDSASKQELYNKYDLIINYIIKRMYSESRKDNKIVLDFKRKYLGRNLYFELAKMIQNLEPTKTIIIDSNYLTYLKLKIKNKKIKIERNKDNLETFDYGLTTQLVIEDFSVRGSILEDIYEAYYKKGATIEQ